MRHPESRDHLYKVVMATVNPRRALVYKIQKKLSDLNASQLLKVSSSIDDGSVESFDDLTEPELYDLIVDFIRGETLAALEDEGMSQLLLLDDMLNELVATDKGADGDGEPLEPPRAVPGSVPPDRASLSPSMGDQVLRFNDVAAFLPRREFKLHGGQISDAGSDMSYSCLCKQIDEGMHEGFTESEVIRTVIKIIKPGTFRDMLVNKSDLTLDELKRFLRAHIRDKNSTELFQELSNARQQEKESPQQFLYRIMGLKQRVLFESGQPGVEFSYDKKLVQGTFLHTLYQGLNEKNNYVRLDLKPLLTDWQVSDDFLLDQITKSTSEEAERLKRLGSVSKPRPVTVSTAQLDISDSAKQLKVDTELQANRAAINDLTAQVSSLTKHLAHMVKFTDKAAPVDSCSITARPQAPTTGNRGKCSDCVQQGKLSCPHCFICGQAGHRAIGCLQRKQSGNGLRPLERGSQ